MLARMLARLARMSYNLPVEVAHGLSHPVTQVAFYFKLLCLWVEATSLLMVLQVFQVGERLLAFPVGTWKFVWNGTNVGTNVLIMVLHMVLCWHECHLHLPFCWSGACLVSLCIFRAAFPEKMDGHWSHFSFSSSSLCTSAMCFFRSCLDMKYLLQRVLSGSSMRHLARMYKYINGTIVQRYWLIMARMQLTDGLSLRRDGRNDNASLVPRWWRTLYNNRGIPGHQT